MITLINPQGYCMGVKRAIKIVDETLKKDVSKPIYLVGKLIHNDYVIKNYEKLGLITLDENNKEKEIEQINTGTLIFQAHGTNPKIIEKAKAKGLNVIDATCPYVKLIHNNIIQYLKKNYDIIYIGKNKHSESEAVLSLSDRIHFVTNINDLNELKITNKNIYVTNQTTLSSLDLKDLLDLIKEKYMNATIDNKICLATLERQEAIINSNYDLIIVVGDNLSSNSKRLYELAKEKTDAIFVSSLDDLKKYNLTTYNNIGITSGASTPYILVKEIYDYLIK